METSGIDILLAMDVSGSMEAMDFTLNGRPSNRLEVVKDVVAKFVKERGNDRIGLVAFAGRPYLVGPLTQDRNWLGQRIAGLKIGQVEDGTAIGSAIASAVGHLKESKAKSRIVILLTDGVNNAGAVNPETSAEAAKPLGIKIYTIGAGTNGEAPMPVRDPLQFARPFWLYAGPVVCAVMAWLFTRFDQRRETDLAKLVHTRFRDRETHGFSLKLHRVKRILWLACLLLLFVALAGPRKGFEFREVKRRGIDILFAVDTSRSMLAEDLSPNRLERARLGIHDFVSRLKGDRVGLIPFAGSAYALCPLTSDYDAFRESLNALNTDLIPRQGTDVASAIREAERLFDEQANNHRILVLITDGEDLEGDALEAAGESAKMGPWSVLHGPWP